MKARPILFSGPMVRAILEGRKTQTRRAIRGQMNNNRVELKHEGKWCQMHVLDNRLPCPYGQPGDLLWVRETFAHVPATAYRHSMGVAQTVNPDDPDRAAIYRAGFDRSTGGVTWKPSIHMPRWASRLTLEITDVRVERLQDISERDCVAEGVGSAFTRDYKKPKFADLWRSINGPESWDANPWVWVVEFKTHQMNVNRAARAS